jgi:hypothetical protein
MQFTLLKASPLAAAAIVLGVMACADGGRNPVAPTLAEVASPSLDVTAISCPDGFVGVFPKDGERVDRNENGFVCFKVVQNGNFILIDDLPATNSGGHGCHGAFALEDVDPLSLADVLADQNLDRKKCRKSVADSELGEHDVLEDNVD